MEHVVKSAKTTLTKKLSSLVTLGSLVLLAGCSSTSAAFTLGKNVTSVTDIQKTVDNILAARKTVNTTGMNLATGAALTASQVQFYLVSQLLADAGTSVGLAVTPAEIAKAKEAAIVQIGGATALPRALVGAGIDPKNLNLYFTSVLFSQKLNAYELKNGATKASATAAITTLISDTATKEGITINPRYGKWDPKTATIVPADATSGAVVSK